MNALQVMDRYLKEVIQVSTWKNDIFPIVGLEVTKYFFFRWTTRPENGKGSRSTEDLKKKSFSPKAQDRSTKKLPKIFYRQNFWFHYSSMWVLSKVRGQQSEKNFCRKSLSKIISVKICQWIHQEHFANSSSLSKVVEWIEHLSIFFIWNVVKYETFDFVEPKRS